MKLPKDETPMPVPPTDPVPGPIENPPIDRTCRVTRAVIERVKAKKKKAKR